jgi:hypothetical protein
MYRFVYAVVFMLLLTPPALAQDEVADPHDLESAVDETVETAKDTQKKLDDWSAERQALETRYRTAQANITYLTERLARQQEIGGALDQKVAELERRLEESGRLQAVIQDTLNVVLGRLEMVVDRDLPFLPEEREARMAGLRRVMAEPDVNPAEKLRRLLEAMLVEAQYGETVEVETADIQVEGRDIHADVLRIGRLAMYWKSPDGSQVGTWDPVSRAWVVLPGNYKRVISRSMEMASRMRPTELVSLPLGRISQ